LATGGRASRTARRRATWTASRSATTGPPFWWHGGILVNLGDGNHQQALGAVSRSYHFAVLPSVQHPLDAVEAQPAFGPVLAVTAYTGGVEQRLNILCEGNVLFLSGFRQLGKVQLAEICFVRGQQARAGKDGHQSHNCTIHDEKAHSGGKPIKVNLKRRLRRMFLGIIRKERQSGTCLHPSYFRL
jgi:hypothetical protein